jgi:hypothetical protein
VRAGDLEESGFGRAAPGFERDAERSKISGEAQKALMQPPA